MSNVCENLEILLVVIAQNDSFTPLTFVELQTKALSTRTKVFSKTDFFSGHILKSVGVQILRLQIVFDRPHACTNTTNAGYVWTVAVFGKRNNICFRKYPGTCGPDLSRSTWIPYLPIELWFDALFTKYKKNTYPCTRGKRDLVEVCTDVTSVG